MTSVLNFRDPRNVLRVEVKRILSSPQYAASAGASASSSPNSASSSQQISPQISSKILAESGRLSISPIFNIGLFLSNGLKLAEGFGSSLKMAEFRACVNALMSMYLVRGENVVGKLAQKHAKTIQSPSSSASSSSVNTTETDSTTPSAQSTTLTTTEPTRPVAQFFDGSRQIPVGLDLPTSVSPDFPLKQVEAGPKESQYLGNIVLSRAEVVTGSA